MADEEDRSPTLSGFAHFSQALLLESHIANREYFIDKQDFWLKMGRDCECKTEEHTCGIKFHRGIDKPFHLGERDDFIEALRDFTPRHAQDRAAQLNVFASGQLGVKT